MLTIGVAVVNDEGPVDGEPSRRGIGDQCLLAEMEQRHGLVALVGAVLALQDRAARGAAI